MTPIIKGAIAAGTLASIGGATYAGVHYLSPNLQISKLIDEEYKHLLLDTAEGKDTSHWEANWKIYKEHKGNLFNLAGWKSEDNTSLDLTKELKQKCASLKVSYVYGRDDDLYKNVTKYCSRWVTVEDEAIKKGLKVLNTKADNGAGGWDQKNTDKQKLQSHIEKLGMTYNGIDANKIKSGCDTSKTKDKKLSNYSDIYTSYVAVCTNPKEG